MSGTPPFELDDARARRRTLLLSVLLSLAVNAALFALCCWKVSAAVGWMFDAAPGGTGCQPVAGEGAR